MKRSLLVFAVLLTVAAWPRPVLRAGVSELSCALLQPLLHTLEFGRGGRATVMPERESHGPVSSDAILRLSIDGTSLESLTAINLRREFYLPMVILVAATLAAPLTWRRRLRALVIGVPLAFSVCFAGLYLTTCHLFAHQAPAIYPLSASRVELLDTLVGALLIPPSVRFFVPLAIAFACCLQPSTRLRPAFLAA